MGRRGPRPNRQRMEKGQAMNEQQRADLEDSPQWLRQQVRNLLCVVQQLEYRVKELERDIEICKSSHG